MSRYSLFLKSMIVFVFLVFPLQSFSESEGECQGDEYTKCNELLSENNIVLSFAGDNANGEWGKRCKDEVKENEAGKEERSEIQSCKVLDCLNMMNKCNSFAGAATSKKSESLIGGVPDYDNDQKDSSSPKTIKSAEFAAGPSGSSMSDALTAEERERLRMQEIITRCGRSNPTCVDRVNQEWRNGVSNYDRNREQIRDNVRNVQRTPTTSTPAQQPSQGSTKHCHGLSPADQANRQHLIEIGCAR